MLYTHSIFLIGPMGTGKTSVGQRLAEKLNQPFYDIDHELEKLTGTTINVIFDIEGESGFRYRESKLLAELTQHFNIVLATGGGVVLSKENRQILMQRGFVIYLKSSIDRLLSQLSEDSQRPLLQGVDREVVLKEMLVKRAPLYAEIADLVIDTDKRSINNIVKHVMSVDR